MVDLSGNGAINDLVSDDEWIIETRMDFQSIIEGFRNVRFMSGFLGLSNALNTLTIALQSIEQTIRDFESGLPYQFGKSSSTPGMGTQIRSDDC